MGTTQDTCPQPRLRGCVTLCGWFTVRNRWRTAPTKNFTPFHLLYVQICFKVFNWPWIGLCWVFKLSAFVCNSCQRYFLVSFTSKLIFEISDGHFEWLHIQTISGCICGAFLLNIGLGPADLSGQQVARTLVGRPAPRSGWEGYCRPPANPVINRNLSSDT